MSDGNAPSIKLSPEFMSVLQKLQNLFSGALRDAKFNSAVEAWSEIKNLTITKKKEIFNKKAHQWNENTAKAIRTWMPKFVQLGEANHETLNATVSDWCRARIWELIGAQFDIREPKDGGPPDNFSRSVEWWIAVASTGDYGIHLPNAKRWKAPHWLARVFREIDDLRRVQTAGLRLRVHQVITEELDLAEIQRASTRRFTYGLPALEDPQWRHLDSEIANPRIDPNFWQERRKNFEELGRDEKTGSFEDSWLRADCEVADGQWTFDILPSLHKSKIRFEEEASEAGTALGVNRLIDPLDAWLYFVLLDARKGRGGTRCRASETGWLIEAICKASANLCSRLATRARRNSALAEGLTEAEKKVPEQASSRAIPTVPLDRAPKTRKTTEQIFIPKRTASAGSLGRHPRPRRVNPEREDFDKTAGNWMNAAHGTQRRKGIRPSKGRQTPNLPPKKFAEILRKTDSAKRGDKVRFPLKQVLTSLVWKRIADYNMKIGAKGKALTTWQEAASNPLFKRDVHYRFNRAEIYYRDNLR